MYKIYHNCSINIFCVIILFSKSVYNINIFSMYVYV